MDLLWAFHMSSCEVRNVLAALDKRTNYLFLHGIYWSILSVSKERSGSTNVRKHRFDGTIIKFA